MHYSALLLLLLLLAIPSQAFAQLTITSPTDGAQVTPPVTIEGTAPPIATIRIFAGDTRLAQVLAKADGRWSATLPKGSPSGALTLKVSLLDDDDREISSQQIQVTILTEQATNKPPVKKEPKTTPKTTPPKKEAPKVVVKTPTPRKTPTISRNPEDVSTPLQALGGLGGAVLGSLAGFGFGFVVGLVSEQIFPPNTDELHLSTYSGTGAALGSGFGFSTGTSLGVFWAGRAMGGRGTFGWTLGGNFIGMALPWAIFALVDEPDTVPMRVLSTSLLYAGSIAGALIGFHGSEPDSAPPSGQKKTPQPQLGFGVTPNGTGWASIGLSF